MEGSKSVKTLGDEHVLVKVFRYRDFDGENDDGEGHSEAACYVDEVFVKELGGSSPPPDAKHDQQHATARWADSDSSARSEVRSSYLSGGD